MNKTSSSTPAPVRAEPVANAQQTYVPVGDAGTDVDPRVFEFRIGRALGSHSLDVFRSVAEPTLRLVGTEPNAIVTFVGKNLTTGDGFRVSARANAEGVATLNCNTSRFGERTHVEYVVAE